MTEREMVMQPSSAMFSADVSGFMNDRPIITPVATRPAGWYVRHVKRGFDIVAAAVVLVALMPLLIAVALVVQTSVGRPIIFTQTRVGRHGVPFDVYKFRTMHADRRTMPQDRRAAGRQQEAQDRRRTHKSAQDPRLTPTGSILRKLSLDELPQLINVLKGEMSLVGPRPELSAVVERHYQPWHHRRHDVRPGITGLWQVTERGNGMMHEHVDIDLDYVDRIGLLTDLKILLLTVPAALGSRRGY